MSVALKKPKISQYFEKSPKIVNWAIFALAPGSTDCVNSRELPFSYIIIIILNLSSLTATFHCYFDLD